MMKTKNTVVIAISIAIVAAIFGGIGFQTIGITQENQQRLEAVRESTLLDNEIQHCVESYDCKLIDSKVICLDDISKSNKISEDGIKRIEESIKNEIEFCQQDSSRISGIDESDMKSIEMVSTAIKLYDEIGTGSFEAFNSGPEFHKGDLYMFVFLDSDGIMVSHGANENLIGESVDKILDIYGNSIGKMIHEKATEQGVWIEYLWEDPIDKHTHPKKAWVVKHDGYIFGSGKYDNKATIESTRNDQNIQTNTEIVRVIIPEGSPLEGCENLNTCYVPYRTEIDLGQLVVWDNVDSNPHSITSGVSGMPDGLFDSELIMPSQSYQFTFSDSGQYYYYCTIHPWMTGIVVVK